MSIKQIAWNAFKKTGDIETFLELRKLENAENVDEINELVGTTIKNEEENKLFM